MPRLLFTYLILFAAVWWGVSLWLKRRQAASSEDGAPPRRKLKSKPDKNSWIQVYDTDSADDARGVMARLEEEELDCILYEQGKKDIHGNPLKGFGIAVPKTSATRAQNVISRLPV